jgi:hypothetical protein
LWKHSAGTLSKARQPSQPGSEATGQDQGGGTDGEVVMSVEVAASYDAITCHIMAFAAFVLAFEPV